MSPQRIQRKRTKGWRMPEGVVYVGRPTEWGNPYEARPCYDPTLWAVANRRTGDGPQVRFRSKVEAIEESVCRFRQWMLTSNAAPGIAELRGKDLACWCPPGQPCHADVLLELANGPCPSCERDLSYPGQPGHKCYTQAERAAAIAAHLGETA